MPRIDSASVSSGGADAAWIEQTAIITGAHRLVIVMFAVWSQATTQRIRIGGRVVYDLTDGPTDGLISTVQDDGAPYDLELQVFRFFERDLPPAGTWQVGAAPSTADRCNLIVYTYSDADQAVGIRGSPYTNASETGTTATMTIEQALGDIEGIGNWTHNGGWDVTANSPTVLDEQALAGTGIRSWGLSEPANQTALSANISTAPNRGMGWAASVVPFTPLLVPRGRMRY